VSRSGPRPVAPKGSGPDGAITRDDIAARLGALQGDVRDGVDSAKGIGIAAAVGVVVVLVIGAYVRGRSRGRKRSTVVEIRRI
jgi:hypothetical protein